MNVIVRIGQRLFDLRPFAGIEIVDAGGVSCITGIILCQSGETATTPLAYWENSLNHKLPYDAYRALDDVEEALKQGWPVVCWHNTSLPTEQLAKTCGFFSVNGSETHDS